MAGHPRVLFCLNPSMISEMPILERRCRDALYNLPGLGIVPHCWFFRILQE